MGSRLMATSVGLLLVAAVAPSTAAARPDGPAAHTVRISNLTIGQPFSPGILVVQRPNFDLFKDGDSASYGLRVLAEDGNPNELIQRLRVHPGIARVMRIPLIGPGSSITRSVRIKARKRSKASSVSYVAMLLNTNDGFVGFNAVNSSPNSDTSVSTQARDAGTEENNEMFKFIPGPCCFDGGINDNVNLNLRAPTVLGKIGPHAGILGVAGGVAGSQLDPALYGWNGASVASLSITRN